VLPVSLIYRTETTTEKWKTEKLKRKKTDVVRSVSKQSGGMSRDTKRYDYRA